MRFACLLSALKIATPSVAALLFALTPGLCLAAPIRIEAPESVRDLLQRYLDLTNEAAGNESANVAEAGDKTLDEAGRLVLERRLRQDGSELLATEGYFSPRIDLQATTSGLVVAVEPGSRASIGAVNIELRGALTAAERARFTEQWALPAGKAFRQADWDSAKQALLRELLTVDYAGARLLSSEALVNATDVEQTRVNLKLIYDAGPRYRYGEIRINGLSRYSEALVERYLRPLRSGEPYRQDDLLAAQTALQNTPYFGSVRVDLVRDEEGAPDATASPVEGTATPDADEVVFAPVSIRLREQAPYEITLGTGYSTNTGARVEANFRSADFFGKAWDLHTGARIEQLSQSAYADVFLPPDGERHRDSFGTAIESSKIQGLGIERVAFAASRAQTRGSIEQRLGLSWQYERQLPNNAEETTNRALTPTIGWLWRHADNPLDPSEGIVAQLQLGAASKNLLSDQNFVRTYVRYSQGIPLSRDAGLLLRGEVGVTAAPSRKGIPQNDLFRAGGSNSVRGYAYQSLGVQEGSATLGGRYLVTLSAEYTRWLNEQWGIAAFIDAGEAADSASDVLHLATGYGLGARWKSPAGPLALDLAWGQREKALRLHFSLAIPF